MKYSAYVPEIIKTQINHYLSYWQNIPKDTDKEIDELQSTILALRKSQSEYSIKISQDLSRQLREKKEHRDMIAGHLRCFHRFARDERMQPVYEFLSEQFPDAQIWDSFIQAAWSVDNNYSRHREGLKLAVEINNEIAQTAGKLVNLLERYPETGIYGADEFFHIPTLLKKTEHTGTKGEISFWKRMRLYVLGDLPEKTDDTVATLRYAWEKAPPVVALIKTIENSANHFTPEHNSHLVKSAVSSRKRNVKTEYLRAFLATLAERNFEMTVPLLNAVATTAAVVLDSSEMDVSYDDVAKAKKSVIG